MRRVMVVGVASCILALAIVGIVSLAHLRGGGPRGDAVAAELADKADEIAGLTRRIDAIERRKPFPPLVLTRELQPAPSLTHNGDPNAPPSGGPAAAPRRPLPTAEDLDRLVATEPRDPEWSSEYEQAVKASLADAFKDGRLREVTCATSVCRIVMEHPSLAEQGAFVQRFWTALPKGYAAVNSQPETDATGSLTTVLRLIRSGHEDAVARNP